MVFSAWFVVCVLCFVVCGMVFGFWFGLWYVFCGLVSDLVLVFGFWVLSSGFGSWLVVCCVYGLWIGLLCGLWFGLVLLGWASGWMVV